MSELKYGDFPIYWCAFHINDLEQLIILYIVL